MKEYISYSDDNDKYRFKLNNNNNNNNNNNTMEYKNNVDRQYNNLFKKVLDEGQYQENRTGIRTKCIFGEQIKMDMREGFPIYTSRKMPFVSFAGETECFIKGFTSKLEFVKRGCNWWGFWCNPQKVPYANDPDTLAKMEREDDLGKIYGYQWRNFSDPSNEETYKKNIGWDGYLDVVKEAEGVDQLKILVDKIREGKDDRRLIVNYWNPLALNHQALPCCHYSFTVHLSPCGSYLDLKWNQRSVDLALGANNTLYGILIHLLAHEAGRIPRYLIASYENVHIYENQIEQVLEQIKRPTHKLPTLKIKEWKFNDIFDWTYDAVELVDYKHSGVLRYPQAAI